MPSEWENIEKTDASRWLRGGLIVGITWTAVGLLGCAFVLAIGRPDRLDAGIFTASTGLLTLLCAGVARRSRNRSG